MMICDDNDDDDGISLEKHHIKACLQLEKKQ